MQGFTKVYIIVVQVLTVFLWKQLWMYYNGIHGTADESSQPSYQRYASSSISHSVTRINRTRLYYKYVTMRVRRPRVVDGELDQDVCQRKCSEVLVFRWKRRSVRNFWFHNANVTLCIFRLSMLENSYNSSKSSLTDYKENGEKTTMHKNLGDCTMGLGSISVAITNNFLFSEFTSLLYEVLHSCLTEQLDPEEVGDFCSALSGTLVSYSCAVYTLLAYLKKISCTYYITLFKC